MDKKMMRSLLMTCGVVVLTACGGGGGGGGGKGSQTGVFLDAEVQGVSYLTTPSNFSGETNARGEFRYLPGDTVTFSIGGFELGTVPAKGVLMPIDIATAVAESGGNAGGITAQQIATNIAILLQTFDADGDPSNGISIAQTTADYFSDKLVALDLVVEPSVFVSAPELVAASQELTKKPPVTADQADQHVRDTFIRTVRGSWIYEDKNKESGANFVLLHLFENGTFVSAIDHYDPNCASGVERGTYTIDADEKQITFVGGDVDTMEGCGLVDIDDGATVSVRFEALNKLTLAVVGEDFIQEFKRIENDRYLGSWADWAEGQVTAVLTLLEDKRYIQAQLRAEPDHGADAGIEFGTYQYTASSTTFTATKDTNANSGFAGDDGLNSTIHLTYKADPQSIAMVVPDEGTYVQYPVPKVIGGGGTPIDPEEPETATLIGSWISQDADKSLGIGAYFVILNFFSDGQYVLAVNHYDDDCGNGVEKGTYSFDPLTKTVSILSAAVDNTGPNGDCGLFENNQGQTFTVLIGENGAQFTANFADNSQVFSRIENNGYKGSWAEWIEVNNLRSVLTLLDDNRYVVANLIGEAEYGTQVGIEFGTYIYGENETIFTCQFDDNGSAGFHGGDEPNNAHHLVVNEQGNLAFRVEDEGDYVFPPVGPAPAP